MRRILGIAAAMAMLTVVAAGWRATPTQEAALQGGWVLTSRTDTSGTQISEPQPGLFVFTGTHYSIMHVNGAEPRGQFADRTAPTDAERVAAYNSFTANSGRYEVHGDTVTRRAYVAKNPNYMGGWPEEARTFRFRIEGDTLRLTWPDGNRDAVFTLRRVEGEPVPW